MAVAGVEITPALDQGIAVLIVSHAIKRVPIHGWLMLNYMYM